MTPSPAVTIEPAGPERKRAIANLIQLYVHDFSEHWRGGPGGELSEEGLFDPYPFLDSYWREPDRFPLLIRVDGRLAGFALVNRVGHLGRPLDRNMAEFFVARKHRRAGVGLAAAHLILERWPGVWEIGVARRNMAALAFWRRVVRDCPGRVGVEELDLATPAWDGALFRLETAPD